MAAKKLNGKFPEELFIEQAIKEGRCTRQNYSMRALGAPGNLRSKQAREIPLDLGHRDRLLAIIEDGNDTHPIVIFVSPNPKSPVEWVADGIHRHSAYWVAKRDSIPAFVVIGKSEESVEREAMEYATMCNRLATLGRTKKDVVRAIMMLLDDQQWFQKSSASIANHVGCGTSTVYKHRASYCAGKGIPVPKAILCADGTIRVGKKGDRRLHVDKRNKTPQYFVNVGRKKVYLGSNEDFAKSRIKNIQQESVENSMKCIETMSIEAAMAKRGITCESLLHGRRLRGLGEIRRSGNVVFCGTVSGDRSFSWDTGFVSRVGTVMLGREAIGPLCRAVIVCDREEIPSCLADLAEAIGIELLTPDQLIASLLRKAPNAALAETDQLLPSLPALGDQEGPPRAFD